MQLFHLSLDSYTDHYKLILVLVVCWLLPSTVSFGQLKQTNFIVPTSVEPGQLDPLNASRLRNMAKVEEYTSITPIVVGDLRDYERNGTMQLQLPILLEPVTLEAEFVELEADTAYTWIGSTEVPLYGRIELLYRYNSGRASGQILVGEKIFLIKSLGAGVGALVEVDGAYLNSRSCSKSSLHDHEVETLDPILQARSAVNNGCNTVRVLVMHTAAARALSNPQDEAESIVYGANFIKSRSGIPSSTLRFEIAGVEPINSFTESGDLDNDMESLLTNQQVIAERDRVAADLVVVLVDDSDPTAFGSSQLNDNGTDDAYIAIVRITVPNARYTGPHEIFHNFGAKHNIDNRTELPNIVFSARGNEFRTGSWPNRTDRFTVMALPDADAPRVANLSNPNIDFEGSATGTANRDNADRVESQACVICAYRPNPPTMRVTLFGANFMVNGQSRTWTANVQYCSNVTLYDWEWSSNGFTYYNIGSNSNNLTRSYFSTSASQVYLRVNITCSDGQTDSRTMIIHYEEDDIRLTGPAVELNPKVLVQESLSPGRYQISSKGLKPGAYMVNITDVAGNIVQSFNVEFARGAAYQFSTSLESQTDGLYFVTLSNETTTITATLVKS